MTTMHFISSLESLREWVNRANIGDIFVYAVGPCLFPTNHLLYEAVRVLTEEGTVDPFQRRLEDSIFEYRVMYRKHPIPSGEALVKKVVRLVNEGKSLEEISTLVNMGTSMIQKKLEANGINIKFRN